MQLAVVGVGPLVGAHHCAAIQELSATGVELACVCDTDVAAAEKYGVAMYTDAFEMAREMSLDGIVIATPTHLHWPVAQACINGAKARQVASNEKTLRLRALLVEKPICHDLVSALALVETAENAGVEVLVGHQRRHSPFAKIAREIVNSESFGALRGITGEFALLKPADYFNVGDPKREYLRQKGNGGPILINLIHDLDLIRYVTGRDVTSVFAATSGSARHSEVEDTGAVTLVFDSGAVGTLFVSDSTPAPWSYEFTAGENAKYPPLPGNESKDCYHFMGAQRSLAFPSLRIYSYACDVAQPGWDAPLSVERQEVDKLNPIQVQMEHFVRVCRGEERPVCQGRDGLKSLAAIVAIHSSAETGLPVQPDQLVQDVARNRLQSDSKQ
eukprot:TRINITY_DN62036_c0_g1_i1.p1 TRINITY_DN62036_c0_g1~~TRINITY_DN62036_c0_g1_i1.p1  ORF type:complete len:387 (+),score=52.97 TRINITY_DN62036_c0_g1_i1:45-1205(+)